MSHSKSNMRAKSKAANANKPSEIMDVNSVAVDRVMSKHQVKTLIHGHTHRPNIHKHNLNQEYIYRYVLGDWYNRFFILSLKNKKFVISKGNLK